MYKKIITAIILIILVAALYEVGTKIFFESSEEWTVTCVTSENKKMDIDEARLIAIGSECGNNLKDTYICNKNSGTWWLGLTIEKEGCAPACVIDVKTKKAEINWRCTGLIVPTE